MRAQLHRPYDNAGLVLLQPDGRNGWTLIATASERRGVWWRWQDGQLSHAIAGIPFQKPALAQVQSLLRRVLIAHQAALLLMGIAWAISAAVRRYTTTRKIRTPVGPLGNYLTSRKKVVLSILTLLTFGLSLTIAVDVLERIPHVQDSVTYLFQAETLARGHLSAPAPPLPDAFAQEFLLVRDGRWYGKYPPGYPALLAIGVLAGAPWLVNPLLAMLTVPLLFALGRRLYPAMEPPALVFVDPGLDWWNYGAVFSANSPWLDGPLVVARDLSLRSNRRLMLRFPERRAYSLSGGALQPLSEP